MAKKSTAKKWGRGHAKCKAGKPCKLCANLQGLPGPDELPSVVQPAPVQPVQPEPVQPAQSEPIQPAQSELIQPAQSEPVQPAQPVLSQAVPEGDISALIAQLGSNNAPPAVSDDKKLAPVQPVIPKEPAPEVSGDKPNTALSLTDEQIRNAALVAAEDLVNAPYMVGRFLWKLKRFEMSPDESKRFAGQLYVILVKYGWTWILTVRYVDIMMFLVAYSNVFERHLSEAKQDAKPEAEAEPKKNEATPGPAVAAPQGWKPPTKTAKDAV